MVWDEFKMESAYKAAKTARVGDIIQCPTCGKKFEKRSYQQAFCRTRGKNGKNKKGNLCKDQYWNFINPRGMGGMKAIATKERLLDFNNEYYHPFSDDAFNGF